jgi:MarR family transcriptional regulator, organic hydroperoxide resistance regulator
LLRRLAPYQREVNDIEFGCLTRGRFQLLSAIIEDLIDCGDKAVALQRYKSTIKDSKVA